jgi:high-affinity nickel-transport protein
LLTANLAVWIWAFLALRDRPVLLGTAAVAYGFGLRHAVDADHIAAIDNVTRRLMQQGQKPIGVGLFFALGHSSVVVLASIVVALATSAVTARFSRLHEIGATIGTCVSFGFLWLIAALNLVTLRRTWATLRALRRGEVVAGPRIDALLTQQGLISRWLQPVYNLMSRSWHMFALGLLFGLGFETATEVLLLGMSADQASHGVPLLSILLFPALFTVGMTLIDASDGVLMMGAYGWAFVHPIRKLYYNIIVTALSAAIAVFVGGVEVLGLLNERFGFAGRLWDAIGSLGQHLGSVGYIVIALFLVCWLVSLSLHRIRGDQ